MKSITSLVALVAVVTLCNPSSGEDITPDKISFNSDTIRKLLPADGKLIEQGEVTKNYVGIALGHEVKANGKQVSVGANLGSPGIVFGDGYVQFNLGAHVEIEPAKGAATLAFNVAARIVLTVEDKFQVKLRVDDDHLHIEGDNEGGKVAVALKKEEIKEQIRKEVAKQGDLLTKHIQGLKIPPELKFVVITPTGLDIVKTKPVLQKVVDSIVSAELHFHTTNDDREGGVVRVEFYSDAHNKFAEVPVLAEHPKWEEKSRHDFTHKFATPIPVPEKIAFARISLTEAKEINIGWNFNATLKLNTANGKVIVFEGNNLRLDTTGGKRPATKALTIPQVK